MLIELLDKSDLNDILHFMRVQSGVIESQHQELKHLKDDRWMTLQEVQEYTGFSYDWVYKRRESIGFFQEGSSIRFKKSVVDAYMLANSITPKKKRK